LRAVSAEYFLEIEAHFARRRGTPFVVNAKDWALMQAWAADGIPLPIVIEAIDSVFDRHEGHKTVNGLSFCKHAVRDLWKERRNLQVGAHEESPEADPGPLLEALAAAIPFEDVAATIRGLKGSVPAIEERLIEIESELVARLATDEIRAEVANALASVPMDEKSRARTEEALLRRFVREHHALPRLTLFV
jgi:hypothetical protein